MLEKTIDEMDQTYMESIDDDRVMQWRMFEIQTGFRHGEFGHLIQAFISKRNFDSFIADESTFQ